MMISNVGRHASPELSVRIEDIEWESPITRYSAHSVNEQRHILVHLDLRGSKLGKAGFNRVSYYPVLNLDIRSVWSAVDNQLWNVGTYGKNNVGSLDNLSAMELNTEAVSLSIKEEPSDCAFNKINPIVDSCPDHCLQSRWRFGPPTLGIDVATFGYAVVSVPIEREFPFQLLWADYCGIRGNAEVLIGLYRSISKTSPFDVIMPLS